jgi:hypothetical protein
MYILYTCENMTMKKMCNIIKLIIFPCEMSIWGCVCVCVCVVICWHANTCSWTQDKFCLAFSTNNLLAHEAGRPSQKYYKHKTVPTSLKSESHKFSLSSVWTAIMDVSEQIWNSTCDELSHSLSHGMLHINTFILTTTLQYAFTWTDKYINAYATYSKQYFI